MKVKDIIKKQTTIIAIAVVLVTIAAISVSYAIFFDIKAGDTQTITAGTLKLTLTDLTALKIEAPISTEEGLKEDYGVSYTIENQGDLPATYKLYVCTSSIKDGVETETATSLLNSLYFATTNSENHSEEAKKLNSVTETYTREGSSKGNCYQIETGTIGTGSSSTNQTKKLKVWVDESELSDDITDAAVNLDLLIVSEVDEANASLNAG